MSLEPLQDLSSGGGLPLLSLLVWLPILGGALCLALGNARPQAARWMALAFALGRVGPDLWFGVVQIGCVPVCVP